VQGKCVHVLHAEISNVVTVSCKHYLFVDIKWHRDCILTDIMYWAQYADEWSPIGCSYLFIWFYNFLIIKMKVNIKIKSYLEQTCVKGNIYRFFIYIHTPLTLTVITFYYIFLYFSLHFSLISLYYVCRRREFRSEFDRVWQLTISFGFYARIAVRYDGST